MAPPKNEFIHKRKLAKDKRDSLLREVFGVLLIGVNAFLVVSLVTFSRDDASFNNTGGEVIHNMAGLSGAYLADVMFQVFGLAVAWVPLVLAMISFRLLRKSSLALLLEQFISLPMLTLVSALLATVLVPPEMTPWLPAGPGGVTGLFGSNALTYTLGTPITVLLLGVLGLISLFILTHFSPGRFMGIFGRESSGKGKKSDSGRHDPVKQHPQHQELPHHQPAAARTSPGIVRRGVNLVGNGIRLTATGTSALVVGGVVGSFGLLGRGAKKGFGWLGNMRVPLLPKPGQSMPVTSPLPAPPPLQEAKPVQDAEPGPADIFQADAERVEPSIDPVPEVMHLEPVLDIDPVAEKRQSVPPAAPASHENEPVFDPEPELSLPPVASATGPEASRSPSEPVPPPMAPVIMPAAPRMQPEPDASRIISSPFSHRQRMAPPAPTQEGSPEEFSFPPTVVPITSPTSAAISPAMHAESSDDDPDLPPRELSVGPWGLRPSATSSPDAVPAEKNVSQTPAEKHVPHASDKTSSGGAIHSPPQWITRVLARSHPEAVSSLPVVDKTPPASGAALPGVSKSTLSRAQGVFEPRHAPPSVSPENTLSREQGTPQTGHESSPDSSPASASSPVQDALESRHEPSFDSPAAGMFSPEQAAPESRHEPSLDVSAKKLMSPVPGAPEPQREPSLDVSATGVMSPLQSAPEPQREPFLDGAENDVSQEHLSPEPGHAPPLRPVILEVKSSRKPDEDPFGDEQESGMAAAPDPLLTSPLPSLQPFLDTAPRPMQPVADTAGPVRTDHGRMASDLAGDMPAGSPSGHDGSTHAGTGAMRGFHSGLDQVAEADTAVGGIHSGLDQVAEADTVVTESDTMTESDILEDSLAGPEEDLLAQARRAQMLDSGDVEEFFPGLDTAADTPDESPDEIPDVNKTLLPPISILAPKPPNVHREADRQVLEMKSRLIEHKLADFKVKGQVIDARPGPVVTTFELDPAPGLKASKVIGLADDLARSISALSVRVVGNIPGKSVIGIEVPNDNRETVYLREILESETFVSQSQKNPLSVALGCDINGNPVVADLARMPHLLVAGTTGSGKSVALNAMICSILYRNTPEHVRFLMVDPKMLELSIYEGIPHLLAPVVTEVKKAATLIKWAVAEMEQRYHLMSELSVRNLAGYNRHIREFRRTGQVPTRKVKVGFDPETGLPVEKEVPLPLETKPLIVIVVDELADLMMQVGKEVEPGIARLAQMARAAGLHLILATQRPSVDVITGLIKANFPTRLAFQVATRIDSRTILDASGAERLLGMGDGLYLPPGTSHMQRVHAPFVADGEVQELVEFLKTTGQPQYDASVLVERDDDDDDESAFGGPGLRADGDDGDYDELYDQAVDIVLRARKVSASMIQRYFKIGYNRASRIVERMEKDGLISESNSQGKREVLVPARPE
ncbi:MAG: DNA translocase FtsK 4TM domain-containing protein [Magnetococcus sp. DMHC-1]